MNRIAVIGCPGSGKSTLSQRLGERLDIPVIHLDRLFWHRGWVESRPERFAEKVQDVVRGEEWVLDGNFGSTQHIVLPAADTIVWLDLPRATCLWRVTKRLGAYFGRTRPDLPEGCPEKLDFEFLEYIWTFHETERPRIIVRLKTCRSDQRLIVLKGPAEVARFVSEIGTPHTRSENRT